MLSLRLGISKDAAEFEFQLSRGGRIPEHLLAARLPHQFWRLGKVLGVYMFCIFFWWFKMVSGFEDHQLLVSFFCWGEGVAPVRRPCICSGVKSTTSCFFNFDHPIFHSVGLRSESKFSGQRGHPGFLSWLSRFPFIQLWDAPAMRT